MTWWFQPLAESAQQQAGGPAPTGRPKVWTGAAWVQKPLKVWNGSAWVEKPVKVWNGSSWVTID